MTLEHADTVGHATDASNENVWTFLDEFRHYCSIGCLEAVIAMVEYVDNRTLPEDFMDDIVDGVYPYTRANLIEQNENGQNPLHFAVSGGHTELVNYLIEVLKVPHLPNHMGNTPLHWAIQNNHAEVVQSLCDNIHENLNVLHKNNFGRSPLSYAFELGNDTILSNLLFHHTANELVPENERELDLEELRESLKERRNDNDNSDG